MVGKKPSRPKKQNPAEHRKAVPRGFAKETNKKIADDLLAAKADIRNGMFDYNSLAKKHGVTYQVVLGVLQRLRRQKKVPQEDPFVRPIGDKWKKAAPLRKSKRKKFITEHLTWDKQDLANRLGFNSVEGLQEFARRQNPPLTLKPRSASKKPLTLNTWLQNEVTNLCDGKIKPSTMDAFMEMLKKRLPDDLSEKHSELTRLAVYDAIDTLCWVSVRRSMVVDANKAKMTAEDLHKLLTSFGHGLTPPVWLVADKMEEVRGRTHAPHEEREFSIPGINRAPIAEGTAELPEKTSFHSPFHALPDNTMDTTSFAFIAAPQIGLPFHPEIRENLTRCGFATARKLGCDAIVIGGGLFRIVLQKTSGPNRLLHDLIARDQEISPESVAEHYRPEMLEILAANERKEYRPLFVTAAERLVELLRGLHKNAVRDLDQGPEFPGPIYITLGDEDLKLTRVLAYYDLLYGQKVRHNEALARVRVVSKLKDEANTHWLAFSRQYSEDAVTTVTKRFNDARKRARKAGASRADAFRQAFDEVASVLDSDEDGLSILREYVALLHVEQSFYEANELETRARMSNLDSSQDALVVDQAVRYLITKIEEYIPHAKVIEQNFAFLRFGAHKEIIKVVCAPPSPGQPYYKEIDNIGPTQRRGELPNLTIVANPAALYYRRGARENYLRGRLFESTVHFVEAPILVDAEAIRKRIGGYNVKVPSVKAALDGMFQGGMLIVTLDKSTGLSIKPLSADTVRFIGRSKKPRKQVEYHWKAVPSDIHLGGPYRVPIPMPNGLWLYPTEAFLELVRRSGMDEDGAAHFGSLYVPDDVHDGSHHENHKEVKRLSVPFGQLTHDVSGDLSVLRRARGEQKTAGYESLVQRLMRQIAVRTPYNMTEQYQEFVTSILNPYHDVFRGILLRAKKSGVVIRAVGEMTHGGRDTCDVGVITIGSGKHAGKTVDKSDQEGRHVTDLLKQRFMDHPSIVSAGINVERWIKAPLFGQQSIGYGRFSFGGGVEYGLHFSETPPSRDSWIDTTHGWVKANRRVGNPSGILDKVGDGGVVCIIHLTGDKHIPSESHAGGDFYALVPANCHTEAFAYMAGGLPENPPGIGLVGIPKDGPDAAPIRFVFLTISILREYIAEPDRPFPWNDICPRFA